MYKKLEYYNFYFFEKLIFLNGIVSIKSMIEENMIIYSAIKGTYQYYRACRIPAFCQNIKIWKGYDDDDDNYDSDIIIIMVTTTFMATMMMENLVFYA